MKILLLPLLLCCVFCSFAQSGPEATIKNLLHRQTEEWNKGNLEGFMHTYWQSDSLLFIGKSGVTRGWQQTLENYKKGYPTPAAMGKLSFDILEVKPLNKKHYFVVGKWMVERTTDNLSGHFSLVLQKINGEWKIIADHSS